MRKTLFALAFSAAALAAHAADFASQYPGPWSSAANAAISKALVKGGATGCGEYYYKASSQSADEYLVYCTRDGKNWVAWLVWPAIGNVIGPNKPAKDMPPPR